MDSFASENGKPKMGRPRIHSVREDAFDEITEESAYWIGFLMADGTISVRDRGPKGTGYAVILSLARRDEDHVKKFAEFLKAEQPIIRVDSIAPNGTKTFQSRLSISSKQMVESLMGYGVVPRKSCIAKAPECLVANRDFWRGYIDGNGCIHVRKNGNPTLGVTGCREIVTQFKAFVEAHAPGSKMQIAIDPRQDERVVDFYISKRYSVKMLDVLYRDCGMALDRKKAQADAILANPENHIDHRGAKKRFTMSLDDLESQHAELGSWSAVAEANGMSRCHIFTIKKRLTLELLAAT